MRTIRCLVLASCAALGAWGMFRMPSNAPVERLVSNMGDYIKAHPQDANGYYTLGRIHYLAFALNAKEIPSTQDGQNMFSPGRPIEQPHDRNAISETQRATHLKEALRLLRKAVELDPKNGLYELGLACVLEDGQPSEDWREQAIAHYLAAYRMSIAVDREITRKPLFGLHSLVGYEAGASFLRLLKERGLKGSDCA